MTVLITLTSAGADTGPFSLYSNLDGFITPFEINVPKAALLAGYSSVFVPDFANIIRIKSTGSCVNFIDVIITENTTTTTTTVPTTTTSTTSSTTSTTTTAPTTTTTSTASTTTTTTTVAPALFCFEVQDILLNNIPVTCLGLPQTNVSKKLVISLKDINGNPVLATEDMAFIADFSEQSCYDPIINTQQTITVLAGTSSAEYGYLEINWSDCGQGDCIGNFIVYEGTTTPPAAYSTLPNCGGSTTTTTTVPTTTTTTTASQGDGTISISNLNSVGIIATLDNVQVNGVDIIVPSNTFPLAPGQTAIGIYQSNGSASQQINVFSSHGGDTPVQVNTVAGYTNCQISSGYSEFTGVNLSTTPLINLTLDQEGTSCV